MGSRALTSSRTEVEKPDTPLASSRAWERAVVAAYRQLERATATP